MVYRVDEFGSLYPRQSCSVFINVLQMVSAVRSALCTSRAHNRSHCCAHCCAVVRQQVKTKSINGSNLNQEEIPLKILPISHIHHGALSLCSLLRCFTIITADLSSICYLNLLPPPLCQEETVRQSFHNRTWAPPLTLPNPSSCSVISCCLIQLSSLSLDSHIIIPTHYLAKSLSKSPVQRV